MATTTSGISELYADVVADLVAYYDNFVLLPNPALIVNSYNISGSTGNTVKVPLTNAWTAANSDVGENTTIIGNADQSFNPTSVNIAIRKRGAATEVSEEALEDGGLDMVRNAVITRLSRSLAQATDSIGMQILSNAAVDSAGAVTSLTGVNSLENNDGYANTILTGLPVTCSLVFSPEAAGYAMKREPTVKMFNDIDKDNHQMVATIRNGFQKLRGDFIRSVASHNSYSANAATAPSLDQFSTSVANLRGANAPTGDGFYNAVVNSASELHLAKELNGVGGISSGSIGSVAQDLANDALLQGLIGQAIGCRFVRSENLPGFTEA